MTNSIALLASQPSEMTMTLKEITDMLGVRHDNAMRTVAAMTADEAFGHAPQIEERYNSGKNVVITYVLNKRQSIAVAAKLNVSLLMNIIDRWQELEAAQRALAPASLSQRVLDDFDLFTDDIDQAHAQMFCMAKETQKLVDALSQRLAVGDYCTWTQLRSVNQHLNIMQSTNGAWIPALVTKAAKAQGIKVEEIGTEGSGTQFRGKSYPTEWLVNTVEHLLKTELYPYVEVKLNVPLRKDIEPRLANKAMTQLELKAAKALGHDDNIN